MNSILIRGTFKFGNYSVKPKGVEATVAYNNHQLAVGSHGDLLCVGRLLIHRKFGGRRTVRVSCFKYDMAMAMAISLGGFEQERRRLLCFSMTKSGRDEVWSAIPTLGGIAASVHEGFAAGRPIEGAHTSPSSRMIGLDSDRRCFLSHRRIGMFKLCTAASRLFGCSASS